MCILNNDMKICVITDRWFPYWGGGQVHISEIAKLLAEKYEDEIHIYTRKFKKDGISYIKDYELQNGKIKIFRVGPKSNFENHIVRIATLFSLAFGALKGHRKYGYDIFHGHSYFSAIPLKIISLMTGKKCVFTVHSTVFTDKNACIAGLIERVLLAKIKFDLEIAVNRNFIGRFDNKNEIVYIPNGVDMSKFGLLKQKGHSDKFTILFVGRLVEEKGLKFLIDALEIFKNRTKRAFDLKIIGEGNLYSWLSDYTKKKNLYRHVKFFGKKEGKELAEEYARADLFILPSLSEGFPLVLLEAMAAKLPVIATNVGMNSEMILNNKNGFIIDARNSESLADAILQASGFSVQDLQKMGEISHETIKHNYTWDIVADKTRKTYISLLNLK